MAIPKYLTIDDLNIKMQYKHEKNFKYNGQLKLLITTLHFIVDHVKKSDSILYIGSGKGYNIPILIEAFKDYDLNWNLYDPNGHCNVLENMIDINVNNKIFDINEAKHFENLGKNLLFISDIRTLIGDTVSSKDLLNDYKLQNQVLNFLNPRAASLKWRCPFPDDWIQDIDIPIGKEYFQPYNAMYSNELRLFCTSPYLYKTITLEDAKDYEELLFYYNKIIRKKYNNDNIICEYIFNKIPTNVKKNINIENKTVKQILYTFENKIESYK